MAVTDEVLRIMQATRQGINELTDQQVVALVTAWVDSWDGFSAELQDALDQLAAGAEDGRVTARMVQRADRLQAALVTAQAEAERLQALSEESTTALADQAARMGANAASQAITAQLPPALAADRWVPLNEDALAAVVARTTQQIHASSIPLSAEMVAAMRRELRNGITVGDNPRPVARRIMSRLEGHFNGGLTRATRIARTELLDAFRAADLQAAQANRSLLTGWVWLCTLDGRSCPACIAMHGTEHPVDEFGPNGHQQCRCVRIDKTKTWAELGFTGIEDDPLDLSAERDEWFDGLTDDSQRRILGPGRYDLFKDGRIGWGDLATTRRTPEWRDSIVTAPLKDLQAKTGG
ncbi:phage minor head protein [Micrococcus terreus]|uniref:phage minor head protein n=1 Tax=Micrococcus terreus TaxID=574650 RepID=UPI00254FC579|nr:phage minor head protein [Micrococcus terreus]MDK7702337.1 phage minor head protein [Micrococcus terreus]WOO97820.1 phage minor head protein [Micrococcus terreus]